MDAAGRVIVEVLVIRGVSGGGKSGPGCGYLHRKFGVEGNVEGEASGRSGPDAHDHHAVRMRNEHFAAEVDSACSVTDSGNAFRDVEFAAVTGDSGQGSVFAAGQDEVHADIAHRHVAVAVGPLETVGEDVGLPVVFCGECVTDRLERLSCSEGVKVRIIRFPGP